MDDIPPIEDPAYEQKVLRAFVRGGRLVSIPARERKKRVILRWLLDHAFPDMDPLDERDVNMRLAIWNPDVSALRRYLVDAGFVIREGQRYRRALPLPARREGDKGDEAPPFA
ncbi:MAG TPA: DUF2087 domain-containing protein [Candidatus Limnocylindrales bacterium]|nr:DUF2087 domain-containing protein [Candidatus Limnocylindrales bacterium]